MDEMEIDPQRIMIFVECKRCKKINSGYEYPECDCEEQQQQQV